MLEKLIREMRDYADKNNVPIMADDGLKFLLTYIKSHNVKSILEIGSAIGYSAIMMCSVSSETTVTTIERDEKRYLEAVKNIKRAGFEDRIDIIYKDAFDVSFEEKFDLIFIDAAKAQNTKFFEMFEDNLNDEGTIITDNLNFHGLVDMDDREIESRNLRQLVRKVRDYRVFLENNTKYRTQFLDIGDGLAICVRK